jgi:hypothetical protein
MHDFELQLQKTIEIKEIKKNTSKRPTKIFSTNLETSCHALYVRIFRKILQQQESNQNYGRSCGKMSSSK